MITWTARKASSSVTAMLDVWQIEGSSAEPGHFDLASLLIHLPKQNGDEANRKLALRAARIAAQSLVEAIDQDVIPDPEGSNGR